MIFPREEQKLFSEMAGEVSVTGTCSAPLSSGGLGCLPVPYIFHLIIIGNKADKEGRNGSSGNLVDGLRSNELTWHLCSDADNPMDHQVPFVPSVEVLVKALIVISSAAVTGPPSSWIVRAIFCSHHPSVVIRHWLIRKREDVWKRLQKCLKICGFDVTTFLSTNAESVCKSLFGPMGLMSPKTSEQQEAVYSLSTMMSLAPEDTFTVFKTATFLDPLLRSPIVSAAAFENLVKLARCTVQPLCNWALEISTSLRLTSSDEVDASSDFRPSVDKAGKTYEDTGANFTVIKADKLHDDVLHILYMASKRTNFMMMFFITCFPFSNITSELNFLQVLYHVLGVVPAYQASVGPALNELCLRLQAADVANALYGVYSKDLRVKMAYLNAVKAAAELLADALHESPTSSQLSLSTLFSLYICDATSGEDVFDAGWIGRQGIALALQSAADVLTTKDLPAVMTFFIFCALADPNKDVRGKMINAGNMIIDKHGKENSFIISLIMLASDEEEYDLVQGVVIFTGALSKMLLLRNKVQLLNLGREDKAWRTKQNSVQLLGAMAFCAPQQLSQCLPRAVPKLTEVLTDTHPNVQSAGQVTSADPNEYTRHSLVILLQTTFVNSVDAPSLALLVPIVHRGLRERSSETKKRELLKLSVLVDPIPEVRSVAARAVGSLIRGMGENNFPDLVPWLFETLKSDTSNVERSGAAQGLSEVIAALGTDYFENILTDLIRHCSHQKASVRDGYLPLFKLVVPAILNCLAHENESVRDAALGAGHVLVEHHATTSLPLLLPVVEDGIFNDNWRIRQSSVELLGDLLFKLTYSKYTKDVEGNNANFDEYLNFFFGITIF
ncbi:Armadillo-type fold [Arabidopsis thaliana x Arabidopsis arenosa]|uniref:Armadillo-type fold n=1 Tax=Arabidopsis thaliana x Arabidopsis arenosa TaxID=1240361 RepID=A0A8T2BKZ2_9BRAS|nr:Armadillo-type fold [Arabidopsis thaliana x Arabidopsis arenosa]